MRLPNGYGSVYKLSGKRRNPWAARKTVGWSFDAEKQKSHPVYKFIGYYPNRRAALDALAKFNEDPYDLHLDTITFEEVYERWSEEYYSTVKPNTVRQYKSAYKLCGPIKDMPYQDIRLPHMQKLVDESGKNTPTLQQLKNVFGLMCDWAIKNEIVSPDKRNVIKYVDISKAGNPDTKPHTRFSPAEVETLWDHSTDPTVSIVLILVYTGLRIDELLTLLKVNVHLDDRWIDVTDAKTKAGIRQVPIAEKIVPLVAQWFDNSSDHLVCSKRGRPISYPNFLTTYWRPTMKDLRFDHSPHDTRHTCTSLLTEAGTDDRILRSILGHTGETLAEKVYTEIDIRIKLEAINRI